jgi:CheY-like chemotaxis protein
MTQPFVTDPVSSEDSRRHDLLGAVHVLGGTLELLLTTRLTAGQRRYVNTCRRAAERLRELGSRVPSNSGTVPCSRRLAIDDLAELGVRYLAKPAKRAALVKLVQSMARKPTRPRVLIADDSEDNCLLIQQHLSKVAQVSVVRDGQSAVDRYQAEPYDLLVMDLDMPVLDGCLAIRAIRTWEARHGRAQTPIIVLTAHDLMLPMAGNEAVEPAPDSALRTHAGRRDISWSGVRGGWQISSRRLGRYMSVI